MQRQTEEKRRESDSSEDAGAPHERRETLWLLTFGPSCWAAHFLLSYSTAAVWCAKYVGRTGSLDGARIAIGIYTLLAIIGIGITSWRGFRQASFGSPSVPHDSDTAADRHRFLGYATLLLCGLSLVATLYVALSVVMIGNCR